MSYQAFKRHYGPAYAKALLIAISSAFFLPIPGALLAGIALVIVIAEVHRAIVKPAGLLIPRGPFMSIDCEMTLQDGATPAQLAHLGAALWHWCRVWGGSNIYQCLDNQALADLIAGRFPDQAELGAVHLRFHDVGSRGRLVTIDRLRREMPPAGVADILVNGKSWNLLS